MWCIFDTNPIKCDTFRIKIPQNATRFIPRNWQLTGGIWLVATCTVDQWLTSIRPVQFSWWWIYYSLHFDQHQIGAICILRSHNESAKLTFTDSSHRTRPKRSACPYNTYAKFALQMPLDLFESEANVLFTRFNQLGRGKTWFFGTLSETANPIHPLQRFWMPKVKIENSNISDIWQINMLLVLNVS